MRKYLKHFVLSLMVLGLVFGSMSIAAAGTFTVNSIDGNWINPVPAYAVTINNASNPSTARWGYPAGWPYNQSGYDFLAATTPFSAYSDGTKFVLGQFTHHNYPITGTSLSTINLDTALGIGGFGTLSAIFGFTHNETPNIYGDSRDNDIVTLTNPTLNAHFISGGIDYYFNMIGFSTDGGNTVKTYFSTVEGQANYATLYGIITETPIATPEPATLLLLGLGLVGLAGAGRKFKG